VKAFFALTIFVLLSKQTFCWGFYAHREINRLAIYLLPPDMMLLFKPNAGFLEEHAVDPDKRRYAVNYEAPRHYIDIDRYGNYPYNELPRKWFDAAAKYSADTLNAYGIVPWWLQTMLTRLTVAFREKNQAKILRYAAEFGHYIADAHVPLHATRNHNGQLTDQRGIHGFWESRIPELLASKDWDFFIGKAVYISNPGTFIWARVLESAAAADSVLRIEKELSLQFPTDRKYAFEYRNGIITRQYSTAYSLAYNARLNGMIERRMRQSIFAVASLWYTAWVNAGQPDLTTLTKREFDAADKKDFENLHDAWLKKSGGREHE